MLKSPFPYFGGKSRVAADVWRRFGNCANYIEPFFGSGAVLLQRPDEHEWWNKIETINDIDGMISNFWRAISHDADQVAHYADWPILENDLHARHAWLLQEKQSLRARLEGNPEWYDSKIAGWWVWGLSLWIGCGWVSGVGPWVVEDGELVKRSGSNGQFRGRPHLTGESFGQGICRQKLHLSDTGKGVHHKHQQSGLYQYFKMLQERFKRVRVCCGDWTRVVGPSVTVKHGVTGMFLDPPYSISAGRDPEIYNHDDLEVAAAVRDWAVENGSNPLMRIALCGYEGEHEMPANWECFEWKAQGGYSAQFHGGNGNRHRERIWFSPHCNSVESLLFDEVNYAR